MSLQRFEARTLDAALDAARDAVGASATVIEANRVRRGGLAGFFAKEFVEVAVEVSDDTGPSLIDLADRASAVESEFHELLRRAAGDVTPDDAIADDAIADVTADAPGRLALPRRAREALSLPSGFTLDATLAADEAVLRAFRTVPRAAALPHAPGSMIAVVGERDGTLALARRIADELGLDPLAVALAAEDDTGDGLPLGCLLPSVPAASEHRWATRRRPEATVVAVVAPVRRDASSYGRRVLAALDADTTWAVVDAGHKPEDVAAWNARLGGVDALAIENSSATETPAAILGIGIPVARIDGRIATPVMWASLVMERQPC